MPEENQRGGHTLLTTTSSRRGTPFWKCRRISLYLFESTNPSCPNFLHYWFCSHGYWRKSSQSVEHCRYLGSENCLIPMSYHHQKYESFCCSTKSFDRWICRTWLLETLSSRDCRGCMEKFCGTSLTLSALFHLTELMVACRWSVNRWWLMFPTMAAPIFLVQGNHLASNWTLYLIT